MKIGCYAFVIRGMLLLLVGAFFAADTFEGQANMNRLLEHGHLLG